MRRLFEADGVLYKIMTMLLELAEMNILFLCCCVPVVTAGAGAVALYEGLICMHQRGEGAFSVKQFFSTVRKHLKTMVPVWCVCLVSMAALVYGMMYWACTMPGMAGKTVAAVYLLLFILVNGIVLFLCMFLALGSKYRKELVKDSFLLSLAKYPLIILTTGMSYSFLVLFLMPAGTILRLLPPILLFWIASPGYVCTGLFLRILKPLYPELFTEEEESSDKKSV